jgi:hypothetical protein
MPSGVRFSAGMESSSARLTNRGPCASVESTKAMRRLPMSRLAGPSAGSQCRMAASTLSELVSVALGGQAGCAGRGGCCGVSPAYDSPGLLRPRAAAKTAAMRGFRGVMAFLRCVTYRLCLHVLHPSWV